jgi:hypothetical protein
VPPSLRHAVMPFVVAGLGACSFIHGLEDLSSGGDGADAGEPDGSTPPDSTAAESGLDAPSDETAADAPATFTIDCADSVVAHWEMNEGSGGVLVDRCPAESNGQILPLAGAATWGMRGQSGCLELEGNAYVSLGSKSELQLGGPFTVAGFVRSDSAPVGYVGVYWNLGGTLGLELVIDPDGLAYAQVGAEGGASRADIGKLAPSTWTHLAFVFEPNKRLEAFRDGKSVASVVPAAGLANTNPSEARMGPITDSGSWKGALDDVVIYSRALSASEIRALAAR